MSITCVQSAKNPFCTGLQRTSPLAVNVTTPAWPRSASGPGDVGDDSDQSLTECNTEWPTGDPTPREALWVSTSTGALVTAKREEKPVKSLPASTVSVRSWLAAVRGNSFSFRELRLRTPLATASSSARSKPRFGGRLALPMWVWIDGEEPSWGTRGRADSGPNVAIIFPRSAALLPGCPLYPKRDGAEGDL